MAAMFQLLRQSIGLIHRHSGIAGLGGQLTLAEYRNDQNESLHLQAEGQKGQGAAVHTSLRR